MERTFKLTNFVLYAKGWYHETDDIWTDLIKMLNLDGFSPFDKSDVYSILLSAVQDSQIYRWTELKEVMYGIHPNNCWKFGYYVKQNCRWSIKSESELPEYELPTAFVYYVLSNLRFISSEHWIPKMPKYTKYPRAKDITIRKIYDHFDKNGCYNKNKLVEKQN
jgi:hypothetical protein